MSYVRLSSPDIDRMEAFLLDFGMQTVHRDARRLYMRGIGNAPYLHVTELGEPGVISLAYEVADDAMLAAFARLPGTTGIEALDAPGGGKRVRLQDPNGLWLEFVAGRESVAGLPQRAAVRGPGDPSRVLRPARVKRISHAAYATGNIVAMVAWYRETLGLLPTDQLFVQTKENVLGTFMRVNAGDAPVDHHVVFVMRGQRPGLHHVSYEVESTDDIFFGYDYLERQSHDHVRGIGRHALGAQIFDYWMSPDGQMHEHWYSHERMTAQSQFNHIQIGEGMSYDTGEKPPERFVTQASPLIPWSN